MAGAGYYYRNIPSSSSPPRNIINRIPAASTKFLYFLNPQATISIARASSIRRNDISMVRSKKSKPRIITISTSEGKWRGKWNCDYMFSLQDLQLHDLLQDVEKDTIVSLSLCVQKINTTFKVWVLPSTRRSRDSSNQLPDIGGDDPSVIYVKPGYEADISSLVQDTIRLATSVNETCSESCEKSEPKLQYVGERNAASTERRWHKLLELKKKYEFPDT